MVGLEGSLRAVRFGEHDKSEHGEKNSVGGGEDQGRDEEGGEISRTMAAVMFTGANRHFFGVFIFLKTMLNLSLIVPQYKPKAPPAWLSNVMDRIKPSKEDGTFAEFWVKTDEQEENRVIRNESPLRAK